ncbi:MULTISPECIES: Hsp20/alpha crystallin family protein [Burkholderia]|uniref:Hsp20/alpha crystallin family protein n=1 Tax=Burkholderia TaxID=32008 RepID=UPI000327FC9A|nr:MULTISPECIES: Hsp20/alpha crystallin family protein [Burkholderia]AGK50748.1 hsp20/alpha crystallin family protein [Burkholderia thailandensis MSMB121]ATF33825.1 Hsp20/alpha crystallin family protein [Burkholderia thailandensis]KST71908.1 molecular chaperone Hsp20 [Burkholderia humptydooensis]KVN06751.1 molecular chaperone Hsp20 [Burkholderia sp. MSMB1552]KWZ50027.1 molecular chaperone Hsp20 [Burkholderia sp. MSMB1588]
MSETTKLPVKKPRESTERSLTAPFWHPIETLRREIDRLLDDFDHGVRVSSMRRAIFDIEPFWRREREWAAEPAVDFVETDTSYEITAELPGLSEKDIEVKLSNGGLSIHGEKHEEKEEKRKGYYVHERRFGAFERYFRVPDGVDRDRIDASFDKGVLKVTLPKTPEASKAEKKIEIKAG